MSGLARPSFDLRVFISSTFQDLETERETLAKHVFPLLRSTARAHDVELTEIDFRWGLTEEESSLGRTVRRCLEEIDTCRPFFIGIIGDRYGWIPKLSDIQKDALLLGRFPWVEDAVIEGASIIDLEFRHGALNFPPQEGTFFYLREAGPNEDPRLRQLKDRIRSSGHRWAEFSDARSFAERIKNDFRALIASRWPIQEHEQSQDEERRAQRTFLSSRRRSYIANASVLSKLESFVAQGGKPVVISGPSGAGKTSLLAYFSSYHQRVRPSGTVTIHFVGATRESASIHGVTRHLALELGEQLNIEVSSNASGHTELADVISRIPETTEPVILIIDALNQLPSVSLDWLPEFIPGWVRLIVSTIEGDILNVLRERGFQEIPVQPLTPVEREALAVRYLGEFRKGLNRDQLRRLSANDKCATPLFLKTVLEELRLLGSYEALDQHIDSYLGAHDLDHLFQQILERFEQDYSEALVRDTLSVIWAMRRGATREEICAISGGSEAEIMELIAALDYHLVAVGDGYNFFHSYLRNAVHARYLDSAAHIQHTHEKLARYFGSLPVTSSRRRVEEPWQWCEAQNMGMLRQALEVPEIFAELMELDRQADLLQYWAALKNEQETLLAHYTHSVAAIADVVSDEQQLLPFVQFGAFALLIGRNDIADVVIRRLLDVALRSFPEDSWICYTLKLQLFKLYDAIGAYDKFGGLVEEMILLTQRPFLDPNQKIEILQSLGTTLYRLRDYDKAKKIFEEQSELELLAYGPNDTRCSRGRSNLGAVYFDQGNYDLAEKNFAYADQIWSKSAPSDVRRTEHLNNIGAARMALRHHAEAVAPLQKAIQITRSILGPNSPRLAGFLSNYANALIQLNDLPEAIRQLCQALDICRTMVPRDSSIEATIQHFLGDVYYRMRDLEKAGFHFREALSLRASTLGPEHPDTLRVQQRLDALHTQD